MSDTSCRTSKNLNSGVRRPQQSSTVLGVERTVRSFKRASGRCGMLPGMQAHKYVPYGRIAVGAASKYEYNEVLQLLRTIVVLNQYSYCTRKCRSPTAKSS